MLIWEPALFGFTVANEKEDLLYAFSAAEAMILGFFGLLVVHFLRVSARRRRSQLGSSGIFVAGFFTVVLSFGVILGIAILGSSFWGYPPYNMIVGLLSLFCLIISPIVVGRVWKIKRDVYWIGVFLGFAVLLVVWFLLAIESFIGTNPV